MAAVWIALSLGFLPLILAHSRRAKFFHGLEEFYCDWMYEMVKYL